MDVVVDGKKPCTCRVRKDVGVARRRGIGKDKGKRMKDENGKGRERDLGKDKGEGMKNKSVAEGSCS